MSNASPLAKITISDDVYATIDLYDGENGEPSVQFRNKWEGGIAYLSLSEWNRFAPVINELLLMFSESGVVDDHH